MIICTDCRKQNRAGAPYCIFCGASLANERIQESQLRSTIRASENNPREPVHAPEELEHQQASHQSLQATPAAPLVVEDPERELTAVEAGVSLPPETHPGVNSTSRKLRLWHIGPILLLLALLSSALWLFEWKSEPSRQPGFEQAERLYQSAQYADAIIAYWKFIDQHPKEPLVEVAAARISAARRHVATSHQYQQQLQNRFDELMQQANLAYQAGRYVEPADDCTYYYLWQATKLLPTASAAYVLQEKMFASLYQQAREALEQEKYQDAFRHYQTLQAMFPDDVQVREDFKKARQKLMN